MAIKVGMVSLGCAKNQVDGEMLMASLKNAGFEVFYGVGNLSFYTKLPLRSAGDTYLFQDRCPMDGISLRRNACARFFDCAAVYDKSRPIPHI